jgi:hypothetical protein
MRRSANGGRFESEERAIEPRLQRARRAGNFPELSEQNEPGLEQNLPAKFKTRRKQTSFVKQKRHPRPFLIWHATS